MARQLGEAGLQAEQVRSQMDAIDPQWRRRVYAYLGRPGEFWRDYNGAVLDRLGITTHRAEWDARVNAIFDDPGFYRLFPEVREVMTDLAARGYRLGVISNSSERLLRTINHFGLEDVLDPVVFSQKVGAEKPDPRVFEFALREAGCKAGDALHVGDDFEADLRGATGAGMRAVWLNRMGRPAPGPCEAITNLRELTTIL